jgi:hypothetical protein
MDTRQANMTDKPLTLSLDADESLVLFEFLSRLDEHTESSIDDAAATVLTKILGLLEKHLVAPFDPKYDALLSAARARILNLPGDGSPPSIDNL